MILSVIAAVSRNGVIGRNNDLPWRLSDDLKRFKATTLGHPVVVGRKTFESFGGRPLPRRRNLVVSRNPQYRADGAEVYKDLRAAVNSCGEEEEVFVCGGVSLYREAMQSADRFYLTRVHADIHGDTHFPEYGEEDWRCTSEEFHVADEKNDHPFSWMILERVGPVSNG